MTKRNDRDAQYRQQHRRGQRPRLNRQAIQSGLVQPSRHHDLEDKQ